jgi:hypothetical protein
VNPFSSLKGQIQAKRLLSSAVSQGRLAHAYIFAGPAGSGRLTAALDLAKVWICPVEERGFCGKCTHCRQIDSFIHPDVRITIPRLKTTTEEEIADVFRERAEDGITPLRISGNTYVSIDQIRELGFRLSRKSFEGLGYVEIVNDAHLMRREAANAMLKTLEEPPAGTLIVLITSRLSGLLPTVRSRAHTVRFGRLTSKLVEEVLKERTDLSGELASKLALHADGCPGQALLLCKEKLDDQKEAERVFSMIFNNKLGCMDLAAEAEVIARNLGRDGLLDLCRDMSALVHDSRRVLSGAAPLTRLFLPDLSGADDLMLQAMGRLFMCCEERLTANVSPAMAFSAAVAGSKEFIP